MKILISEKNQMQVLLSNTEISDYVKSLVEPINVLGITTSFIHPVLLNELV